MRKRLHLSLLILFFFEGVVRLFELPIFIVRAGAPLLVIILLVHQILNRKIVKLPLANLFVLLVIVSVFSALYNDIPTFQTLDFLNYVFMPYVYFIVLINEGDTRLVAFVKKTIIVLFAIQVPASIIKLLFVGQVEDFVGTVSLNAGSLSTIVPLMATSFLFSKYLYERKFKFLIWIFLFVVFGLIGEKRAIAFIIPALILIMMIVYFFVNKVVLLTAIKSLGKVLVLGLILMYIMVILNPSLTPEGRVGGSFDMDYVVNYVKGYESIGEYERGEISRTEGVVYFLNYILKSDKVTMLFGEGAGKLLVNDENPMITYYGIRYGGRMGIVWLFLQVGLIGAIIYLIILFSLLSKLLRSINKGDRIINLACVGMLISVIWDTLIYSSSSVMYFVVSGTLFVTYGFSIIYNKSLVNENSLSAS